MTALLILLYGAHVSAQNTQFTANLSFGSMGTQVIALQQILNRDESTRVASIGPGSPGNETSYFGSLTKSAVIKFQEKYANEILVPAGLSRGNGYVGPLTRAKLNALPASVVNTIVANSLVITTTVATSTDYLVKDGEKIDIYLGDKMIEGVQNKITSAINSAIASQSTATATMPFITTSDVPSIVIKELSPQFGGLGTRVSITGTGISSNSALYFGSNYIVRTVNQDSLGNLSFAVPPIPPARYDIAIKTGSAVSNTAAFVITDPKNPSVHIQSIYPVDIKYGGTLTITGSGFSPQNNVVVTTYQKFINVSSFDGKTLVVQISPDSLRELAKVGRGTDKVPVSLYIVNEYGFSNSEKLFNILL